jgi:hypothetical protein
MVTRRRFGNAFDEVPEADLRDWFVDELVMRLAAGAGKNADVSDERMDGGVGPLSRFRQILAEESGFFAASRSAAAGSGQSILQKAFGNSQSGNLAGIILTSLFVSDSFTYVAQPGDIIVIGGVAIEAESLYAGSLVLAASIGTAVAALLWRLSRESAGEDAAAGEEYKDGGSFGTPRYGEMIVDAVLIARDIAGAGSEDEIAGILDRSEWAGDIYFLYEVLFQLITRNNSRTHNAEALLNARIAALEDVRGTLADKDGGQPVGGIDFRAMPVAIQPVAALRQSPRIDR